METTARSQFRDIWRKMSNEERKAAVHEEVKRMSKLPANSTYASHRLRVLNKLLQLMALEDFITGNGAGVAFCWTVSMSQLVYLEASNGEPVPLWTKHDLN